MAPPKDTPVRRVTEAVSAFPKRTSTEEILRLLEAVDPTDNHLLEAALKSALDKPGAEKIIDALMARKGIVLTSEHLYAAAINQMPVYVRRLRDAGVGVPVRLVGTLREQEKNLEGQGPKKMRQLATCCEIIEMLASVPPVRERSDPSIG